jgi:hypothetical protein
MSIASEVYTITAALEKAEEVMDLKKNWKPKNEIQQRFVTNLLPSCRDSKVKEIELEVSDSAEKINTFLEKKGFSIRLQPFPPNTLGFASILDLIVEWLYPGEKVKIDAKNGGKYDGVRIKKDGVSFYESTVNGYKHIIACINTKSRDMVFITVPKEPLEGLNGLDIIEMADTISKNMDILPYAYDGVRFPMVDLNIINNIEWLSGMSTLNMNNVPAEITQAIQQIKIKMNEKGARFQSATAVAVTLKAIMVPKQDLIIREPFLVWVEKHNLEKPLMAAFITEESWKNPGSLV